MLFKLLNGAASPANCARKIPGPLIVLIVPSTPPSIYDEVLRRAFFRPIRSQEKPHVRDVIRKHTRLQTLPGHNFLFELRRIPQFDLPLGPIAPGEIVLTRMPKGPNSRARTRVNPVTDALITLYTGRPVCFSLQIIDPRLTIAPPPSRFICGATACAAKNICRKFTAIR